MTSITRTLIKKCSEHNDGILGTLEEISMHQRDITKLDVIQNCCRNLRILLLQCNRISKIENVGKLIHLKYLNLAINNIEVIENLEKCESLETLDLTLNFIGKLSSVQSLRFNENLKTLQLAQVIGANIAHSNILTIRTYLMGNPCSKYDGYRQYVIATLSRLKTLDGADIEHSDRIKGKELEALERKIADQEILNETKRMEEATTNDVKQTDDINKREFWNVTSYNTPETRNTIAEEIRKMKCDSESINNTRGETINKKVRNLFHKVTGKPLNINEPKVPFQLNEEENSIILIVFIYKYMETKLLDVNIHPNYAQIYIKDKLLQLALPEEVNEADSTAKRDTRKLIITMPKKRKKLSGLQWGYSLRIFIWKLETERLSYSQLRHPKRKSKSE